MPFFQFIFFLNADVEAPVFQNCRTYPLVVNATTLPAVFTMDIPVVTDNSGMKLLVVVEPSNFSLPYLIYQVTFFIIYFQQLS